MTRIELITKLRQLKMEAVETREYFIATVLRDAEAKITIEYAQPLCKPCKSTFPDSDNGVLSHLSIFGAGEFNS